MLQMVNSSKPPIRKPQIPVCYEAACKALTECLSMDEAKLWNSRAEALAAWAKIYHDNDAARKAKALRLLAYRRMGQLSLELTKDLPKNTEKGTAPGARALLRTNGLAAADADSCLRLAKAKNKVFEKAMDSDRPPAPSSFLHKVRDQDSSDMAIALKRAFVEAVPFCRKTTALKTFTSMSKDERVAAVERLLPLCEWLDEFIQRAGR